MPDFPQMIRDSIHGACLEAEDEKRIRITSSNFNKWKPEVVKVSMKFYGRCWLRQNGHASYNGYTRQDLWNVERHRLSGGRDGLSKIQRGLACHNLTRQNTVQIRKDMEEKPFPDERDKNKAPGKMQVRSKMTALWTDSIGIDPRDMRETTFSQDYHPWRMLCANAFLTIWIIGAL